jgi:Dienelactone hydrolase family
VPNTIAEHALHPKASDLSKILLFASFTALSSGCAVHLAGHCTSQQKALEEKLALLPVSKTDTSRAFIEEEICGVHEKFTVFVPKTCYLHGTLQGTPRIDPGRAPVVICEELFTLSPTMLKLGQRLADAGFAVYIPILFGNAYEDPNSPWMQASRGLSFGFGRPDWKANDSDADDRPVIHEIAGLCTTIAAFHPNKKLGVIGLCISGSSPLELLAEGSSPIAAPVISQPAIPVIATNFERRGSFGMSK